MKRNRLKFRLTFPRIQYRLNFSMDTVHYIKSFSKGQITIPKKIRDKLGLGDEFWLKLVLEHGKIIVEPMKTKQDRKAYIKKVLSIKGDWFNIAEYKKMREEEQEKKRKEKKG